MGNPWSWGLTRSMRRLNSTLAVLQRGKGPCGCGVTVIAHRRSRPPLAADVAETADSKPIFRGTLCVRATEKPCKCPRLECLLVRKRQQGPPQ